MDTKALDHRVDNIILDTRAMDKQPIYQRAMERKAIYNLYLDTQLGPNPSDNTSIINTTMITGSHLHPTNHNILKTLVFCTMSLLSLLLPAPLITDPLHRLLLPRGLHRYRNRRTRMSK